MRCPWRRRAPWTTYGGGHLPLEKFSSDSELEIPYAGLLRKLPNGFLKNLLFLMVEGIPEGI